MHTFRHCPYCGEKLDFSLRHICPHCRQRYGFLYSHWPAVLLLLGGCILIDWLGLVYSRWIWLGMLPYAAFWLFIVCPFLCPKFSKSSLQAPIPEGLGTPGAQALRFVPSYRAEADTVKRLRRGDVLLPTGELRYTVPPVLVGQSGNGRYASERIRNVSADKNTALPPASPSRSPRRYKMNLFFTRYSRCPRCGKKAAAGLKKTELRLGIWEYRCENCKNVC